ncbi:hypothetical protein GGI11_006740, partial [Coemansia sp. RSA 2049]
MDMLQQTAAETTIVWPEEADSVAIRGTFSNDKKLWWKETIPLTRAADVPRYSVTLALGPGRYEFKFILNGSDWRISSDRYDCVDDGSGNTNNVIVVAEQDAAQASTKH